MDENKTSPEPSRRSSGGLVSLMLMGCIAAAVYFLFWERPTVDRRPAGSPAAPTGGPVERQPARQPAAPAGGQTSRQPAAPAAVPVGVQTGRQPVGQPVVPAGGQAGRQPAGQKTASQVSLASFMTGESFSEKSRSGVMLVDFWAVWCGPCRTQDPIVEAVAKTFDGKAIVTKIDVDKEPQLADRFNIRSVPTIIILKDGKEVKRFVGVTKERDLSKALNAAL